MDIAVRSFNTISLLGSSNELFELFELINDNLLIDRLYKRYVRRTDTEQTLKLLDDKANSVKSNLLNKLREKVVIGVQNSEYFKKYGEYVPIRLIIGDMPYPLVEEEIPLEDYDNLEGDPLWMRPEYMLEKYGQ